VVIFVDAEGADGKGKAAFLRRCFLTLKKEEHMQRISY